MNHSPTCWCGNAVLQVFSPDYLKCIVCGTLVAAQMPGSEISQVHDDEKDFYGREYWFSHQEVDLGQPNIAIRSRTDLPERCLHWLRTLLKYKLPPGHVLELGSAHGGFVALLRWTGFDAIGLELSPWVAKFACETVGVPTLLGPVESQQIEPSSLDAIALMDVLEHLPDPQATMSHCLSLLKPNGIMVIQTPCYPEGKTYEELLAQGSRFLDQFKKLDHLYLFSRSSIREFFHRLGADHLEFEPAIFAHYDMFFIVSRAPFAMCLPDEIERALSAALNGRLVQALLDLDDQFHDLKKHYVESEADRAARLIVMQEQGERLGQLEADRNSLQAQLADLRLQFETVEADRAARLEVIHQQGHQLSELQGAVHAMTEQLKERELLREAHEQQIKTIMAQLRMVQQVLQAMQQTRAYKLLRRMGRWQWVDAMISQSLKQ